MKKRKGSRTLRIDGATWNYYVGKSYVNIRSDGGKSFNIPLHSVTTVITLFQPCEVCGSGCEYGDTYWEANAITPKSVSEYIRHKLS